MIRALAVSLFSLFALSIQAQQSVPAQQQVVQVECRDLATTGNYLASNEALINGKACRPAGTPLQVVQTVPESKPAQPTAGPSAPPAPVTETPASIPSQQAFARPVVDRSLSAQSGKPRIYISPAQGFESYLAAAMTKKHVPAQILQDQNDVDYVLSAAPVQEKPESTGGKVARCLFMYCGGIEGSQTASVTLTDVRTNVVVWAYNVRKGGSKNYQSSAEACAKHLKEWLERKAN